MQAAAQLPRVPKHASSPVVHVYVHRNYNSHVARKQSQAKSNVHLSVQDAASASSSAAAAVFSRSYF